MFQVGDEVRLREDETINPLHSKYFGETFVVKETYVVSGELLVKIENLGSIWFAWGLEKVTPDGSTPEAEPWWES